MSKIPWRAGLSTTVKELRFLLNPRVSQSDGCRSRAPCASPTALDLRTASAQATEGLTKDGSSKPGLLYMQQ